MMTTERTQSHRVYIFVCAKMYGNTDGSQLVTLLVLWYYVCIMGVGMVFFIGGGGGGGHRVLKCSALCT